MSDWKNLKEKLMEDPEFRGSCEDMEPLASVSTALISGRVANNLTQKELADLSGIAQPDISKYERCEGNPSVKTLRRLAECLGMKVQITFVPKDAD